MIANSSLDERVGGEQLRKRTSVRPPICRFEIKLSILARICEGISILLYSSGFATLTQMQIASEFVHMADQATPF
jgi:hypothetical protein